MLFFMYNNILCNMTNSIFFILDHLYIYINASFLVNRILIFSHFLLKKSHHLNLCKWLHLVLQLIQWNIAQFSQSVLTEKSLLITTHHSNNLK